MNNLVLYITASPLAGMCFLLLTPSWNKKLIKKITLIFSSISFLLSMYLWVNFNKSIGCFQSVNSVSWGKYLNLSFTVGIDGISVFFLILTTLLIPLCVLVSWSVTSDTKNYFLAWLALEFFLLGVFTVLDLLIFYVLFESVLVPMYIIVGIWGSRERKIRAAYFLFLYTLLGSVLMLIGILYIYYQVGTTDYETLLSVTFTLKEEKLLWLAFFASFATKVPMVPVHIWLPEAHVEAPTAGSVILAGVLLKLGTYGILRFSFALFPTASFYFTPLVYSIASVGVIYTSLTAIRQTDFKRILAYTSVAHMNLVIIGMFSFTNIGIEGAILQSLSHGFVASALFVIVGVVYDRHHSRTVKYYGGLTHTMPIYILIFLFFTMANIGLPGTGSFVGEFLILVGSYQTNITITILGATGMVLGGCYALWLFNRIAYGNLKTQYLKEFSDLNLRELLIFIPLILGTLLMGVYPEIFLDPVHLSVSTLLEKMFRT